MKVILAETLGFCGGVRRAVDKIYKTLDETSGDKVYMEGPIIHNNSVIRDLESKGVSLLGDIDDLSDKKVVIRAHGITPELEDSIKERGGEVVDGTCPIVKTSQIKIQKFVSDGYFVVISGDKGHAEVIGLVGQAPNDTCVVAKPEDLKNYTFPEKTLLISQTTFSKPEFFRIEEALKEVCPTMKSLCTICGATKERQDAVIELANSVDAIVVVGGRTSSNTKRLKKAVEDVVPTWLIEDVSELPDEIKQYKTIGVTAGASTPDNIIRDVVNRLESY